MARGGNVVQGGGQPLDFSNLQQGLQFALQLREMKRQFNLEHGFQQMKYQAENWIGPSGAGFSAYLKDNKDAMMKQFTLLYGGGIKGKRLAEKAYGDLAEGIMSVDDMERALASGVAYDYVGATEQAAPSAQGTEGTPGPSAPAQTVSQTREVEGPDGQKTKTVTETVTEPGRIQTVPGGKAPEGATGPGQVTVPYVGPPIPAQPGHPYPKTETITPYRGESKVDQRTKSLENLESNKAIVEKDLEDVRKGIKDLEPMVERASPEHRGQIEARLNDLRKRETALIRAVDVAQQAIDRVKNEEPPADTGQTLGEFVQKELGGQIPPGEIVTPPTEKTVTSEVPVKEEVKEAVANSDLPEGKATRVSAALDRLDEGAKVEDLSKGEQEMAKQAGRKLVKWEVTPEGQKYFSPETTRVMNHYMNFMQEHSGAESIADNPIVFDMMYSAAKAQDRQISADEYNAHLRAKELEMQIAEWEGENDPTSPWYHLRRDQIALARQELQYKKDYLDYQMSTLRLEQKRLEGLDNAESFGFSEEQIKKYENDRDFFDKMILDLNKEHRARRAANKFRDVLEKDPDLAARYQNLLQMESIMSMGASDLFAGSASEDEDQSEADDWASKRGY